MSLHKSLGKTATKLFIQLHQTRRHYTKVFKGADGDYVLRDLMKFVNFHGDLYDEDIGKERYQLGKRRVVLRILALMKKTDEEIDALTSDRRFDEDNE